MLLIISLALISTMPAFKSFVLLHGQDTQANLHVSWLLGLTVRQNIDRPDFSTRIR